MTYNLSSRIPVDPSRVNVNTLGRGKLGLTDDPLSIQDLAHRIRVNPAEPFEIDYWCKKWGCTEIELRAAVRHVGAMPGNVEHWLQAFGHKRK